MAHFQKYEDLIEDFDDKFQILTLTRELHGVDMKYKDYDFNQIKWNADKTLGITPVGTKFSALYFEWFKKLAKTFHSYQKYDDLNIKAYDFYQDGKVIKDRPVVFSVDGFAVLITPMVEDDD